MRKFIALTTLWGIVAFTTGGLTGCSTSPATGKMQFVPISQEREITLGQEAAPQFIQQYGGEIPSEQVQQYVRRIGRRLAAESERPDLPWQFYVVDSDVVNAFALPGGQIFVTRGLLSHMNNEAQLAGVLGHEIGHVTDRHIGERMGQAIGVQAVAIGIGMAGAVSDEDWLQVLGVGTSVGGGLYLLSFNREQESTSDRLGMRYMSREGYNPAAMAQVMEVLKEASGGGSGGLDIFATHPNPDQRIADIERILPIEYPGYNNPRKYQLYEDRYQRNVLAELRKLPKARHQADAGQVDHQPRDAVMVYAPELDGYIIVQPIHAH